MGRKALRGLSSYFYFKVLPFGSNGRKNDMIDPMTINMEVTEKRKLVLFSNSPLTICAMIEANLPVLDKRPIPVVLMSVGYISVDRASRAFHPLTEKALNAQVQRTATHGYFW